MKAAALASIAAAIALASCGSSTRPGDRVSGRLLRIYSSLPLQGDSSDGAAAALAGERLALARAHGRVGSYRVALRVLDDATPQRGGWDPGQTSHNARVALADPATIGYLGELNSGASAISIPLLNKADIAQISPGGGAVGLTSGGAEVSPGEPQKYYPTGARTYVRLAPDDAVQAAAQVAAQRSTGCRETYVLFDGGVDGQDTAESFSGAAKEAGLGVPAVTAFDPRASDFAPVAAAVAASGADCVLLSGIDEAGAAALARALAAALPRARLFATAELAGARFTDPARGGVPPVLDRRLLLTAPLAGYRLYGYEAMSLLLASIARATAEGSKPALRSRVVAALFGTRERPSVLGSYSVERDGETTLRRYGIYRLVRGRAALWRTVTVGD